MRVGRGPAGLDPRGSRLDRPRHGPRLAHRQVDRHQLEKIQGRIPGIDDLPARPPVDQASHSVVGPLEPDRAFDLVGLKVEAGAGFVRLDRRRGRKRRTFLRGRRLTCRECPRRPAERTSTPTQPTLEPHRRGTCRKRVHRNMGGPPWFAVGRCPALLELPFARKWCRAFGG